MRSQAGWAVSGTKNGEKRDEGKALCADVCGGGYTGTYTEKGEISATADFGFGPVEISGQYEDFYDETPVSMEELAGSYGGFGISRLTGGWIPIHVEADTVGNVTMSPDQGCSAVGQIAPQPTGKNVFDLSITFNGVNCALGNGTRVTGVGLADGAGLLAMAVNPSGDDGFVYRAEKSSQEKIAVPM